MTATALAFPEATPRSRTVGSSTAAIDQTFQVGGWARSDLSGAIHDATVGSFHYRPLSVALDRASFARSVRPRWATVTAVVTSPTLVGLFFLMVRTTESFTVVVREDHTGLSVRVHGRVDRSLLDEVAKMCASGPGRKPALNGASGVVPAQTAAPSAPLLPVPSPTLPGVAPPVAVQSAVPVNGGGWATASPPPYPGHLPLGVQPDPAYASAPPPTSAPVTPEPHSAPRGVPAPPPQAPPGLNPWLMAGAGAVAADDRTRVVSVPANGSAGSPSRGPLLTVRFENGRSVEVGGLALVGRDPAAPDGEMPAQLVVVEHDTVSKTHLAIGVTDGVAWAADRHSTNGTALIDQEGREVRLEPGRLTRIDEGCSLRLGAYWARIERLA